MKFIQRLADGLWISGHANGFDLYTGWIDLNVQNIGYEKKVWVDLTIVQTMLGQDTTHQVSIPAEFKETLADGTERWGCHTPEFPPVMGYPGMVSYIRKASYKTRMVVNGQEITDLNDYTLYRYQANAMPQQNKPDPLTLLSQGLNPSPDWNSLPHNSIGQ